MTRHSGVAPERRRARVRQLVRAGDWLFHGKGGCAACHGAEGEGMPARGHHGDLTVDEMHQIAGYAWAISQV